MFNNKNILITGASSGIGEACAIRFAEAGANLILCARRHQLLKELAVKLQNKYNTKTYLIQLDVSNQSQISETLQSLPQSWKNIDVLINNAGLAMGLDSFQNGNLEDWDVMIDTNVKGLIYITNAILPGMVARNHGHVINIGSVAGHTVYPKGAVYCATKHAVKALTMGLRMDLLGTKIRVSSVDPGMVETNFSKVRFKGDVKRAEAVYQGLQSLKPEDVADAVFYCASCPPHVNISEIIIMPTDQASATMSIKQLEKQ